jgi:hypothetical protein
MDFPAAAGFAGLKGGALPLADGELHLPVKSPLCLPPIARNPTRSWRAGAKQAINPKRFR